MSIAGRSGPGASRPHAVIRSTRVRSTGSSQSRDGCGRRYLAEALLGLALAACRPARLPEASATPGAVVARVGGVPITSSDVANQMALTPGLSARQALEQRITFEVLAQAAAAERPALTADDLVQKKQVEVARLVERELEPQLLPESIPDADVRALYARGKRRFVHGRLVQATVLCLFTGARMSPERRARVEQNAKLLDSYLKGHLARTAADLEALAKEPPWVERQVSATTVWQDQDQGEPFPSVVARALAALHAPGDRSPLVGDETGYYIAQYLAEQPPQNQSFEEVAPALRAEMYEPWRRQRFLRLTMDLSAGHEIEVFPDSLNGPER